MGATLVPRSSIDLNIFCGSADTPIWKVIRLTWELMGAALADGSIAILISLAMSFGLIAPKLVIDCISEKETNS